MYHPTLSPGASDGGAEVAGETNNQSGDLRILTSGQRRIALSRFRTIKPLLRARSKRPTGLKSLVKRSGKSRATILRWLRSCRESGIVGLVRWPRSDAGKRWRRDAKMVRRIQRWYLRRQRRTMRQVWDKAVSLAGKRGKQAPSYRTIRRICAEIPAAVRCLARDGESAYRNRFEPIARFEVARPNQRWHVDHTKLDIMLLRKGQKPGRPWLTLVLDARSRWLTGYRLGDELCP